ncbi:MFS transporter [bacterium]|nr:MFS transporter [candidate division CSSED10-310 bacterium]
MKSRGYVSGFVLALVLFAFGSAINNSIFSNYLHDVFRYTAEQRGFLELPRELPGLLVTFTIGAFFFLSEMRFLGVACLVASAGIFGVGVLSPTSGSMLFWVFIWSTGIHVQLVLLERVAMDIGIGKGRGHRLGRMNGLRSFGMILGTVFVSFIANRFALEYRGMFVTASAAMAVSGILYLILGNHHATDDVRRVPFVLKAKYSRYYLLAALFGIRKQIFITFAPWFLIKILDFRAHDIARVLMVGAAIGIFAKPLLGRIVDRFGEKRVLTIDGIIIALMSLGYVLFPLFIHGIWLVIICSACFILDDLLFTLRTARTTWLVKIADSPEDVTGAMSASVSIDHLLSMSVSWIAGLAWIHLGYQIVFIVCVVIAVIMSLVSTGISVPSPVRQAAKTGM